MDDLKIIVLSAGAWHPQWAVASMQSVPCVKDVHPMVAIDSADHDWVSDCGRIIRMSRGYRGAAQNYWWLIERIPKDFSPTDIVAFVDLDDQLRPGACDIIRHAYQDPNIWVTHGSYQSMSGAKPRFNKAYPKGNRKIRNAPWCATHLKTARLGLVRKLSHTHFHGPDNTWLDVCSDMALMFPLIEMAGIERVRHISNTIYIYNDVNPRNDHKIRGASQKGVEKWLRAQPKAHWQKGLA